MVGGFPAGDTGLMSSIYQHPSLQMSVTPEQRDRAEAWLQEAYADGRVSEPEFDRRIGQILSADSRKDLNDAFYGLVSVPAASQAMGVHPAYQPLIRPEIRQQAGRGVAGAAHFSAFFLWLFGPGMVYALSSPGTYARREAAKAFNFQLVSSVSLGAVVLAGGLTKFDIFGWLFAFMILGWFILTVLGGAKALQGEDWRNPVKQVVKLEVLPEK